VHLECLMKEKIILIAFGTIIGLLGAFGLFLLRSPHGEGVEFENVDEFRQALQDPRGNGRYRRPDGSLPFVAVIESSPSDDIIYTLRPHLNDNFTGVNVKTNSLGMRSPERPTEKAPNVYRIALMGDSFAFGWGVEQDKGFAQVMEDSLNSLCKGINRFEVLNFGIPGYATFQEVALFQERALQFKPDAVLFFFVENDFDFPFFIKDKSNSNALMRSLSLGALEGSESQKVRRELLRGRDPVSSFIKLDEVARQEGVVAFLAVNPRKNWRAILKKLSPLRDKTSIRFIEFGDKFERIVADNRYTDSDMNLPNDPHPTALRHRIYGELLAQEIGQALSCE